MLNKFKRVLIICAHPDDEVIGCGGTIAKLSKKTEVSLLIFTNGESSREYSPKILKKKILKRKALLTKSSKNLGIKYFFQENLNDNELDNYSNLKITKIIEKYLAKLKPDTIFTHYQEDLNIDHKKVSKAVVTATRPYKANFVKHIFNFEIPSSTDVSFGKKSFKPNFFVDISKTIKKKRKSLNIYKNQFTGSKSLSISNIIGLSKYRGNTIGVNYAEAFEVLRLLT